MIDLLEFSYGIQSCYNRLFCHVAA